MSKVWDELIQMQSVRENLSALRKEIKDPKAAVEIEALVQQEEELFYGFLHSEDAKTRKNAALLLGDLGYERAVEVLLEGYRRETTLFVRSAYLQALSHMDVEKYLPLFEGRLTELMEEEPRVEERKHVEEEIRSLRSILNIYQGMERHTFDMKGKRHQLLLVTNSLHRKLVCSQFPNARVHPLGVLVETAHPEEIFSVRTYRDILFVHGADTFVPADPKEAAAVLTAWMQEMCDSCHSRGGTFAFRIECKSHMSLEERSRFTKRLGAEIERISKGALVNCPGEYEVELRLIENKEGKFFPALKFFTLKDPRFVYRRNAIASSIHPSLAALIVELASPYLKENAQIMDPFCGVGTMLIERNKSVPAKEIYGTDIFADAIVMGRENAEGCGARIHFIHRDFFDFKHEYLFDEIITNMPVRGTKTKEEMDRLYGRFFEKALVHMKPKGILVLYTNETGFVKKQIRLNRQYRLLQETLIQNRNGYSLFILEVKG